MLKKVIFVGLGGALGALMRYSFLVIFPDIPGAFPYTVFAENMIGSFLLGFILILVSNKWKPSWPARSFLGTGLLGSFTTFSSFSLDIVKLIDGDNALIALMYLMLSIMVGLSSAFTGMMLARKLGGPS
ncbi:MAG: CrcB family protein [Balneolales bacterium]